MPGSNTGVYTACRAMMEPANATWVACKPIHWESGGSYQPAMSSKAERQAESAGETCSKSLRSLNKRY